MDNVKFRQAVAHAIDRAEITTLLNGGQLPISGWFPKGLMGFTQDGGVKFDPEKAKQLLKEAGYDDPKKVPRVTLGFNTNDNHRRIAENVQAQLKRNLGIDVEIKNEEWKVYLKSLQSDAPQVYRMGWQADYPDPDNFINLMTSYSENNHTNWGNPEFDKLVEEGASELDPAKREQLYVKAQQILIEKDTVVAPIYSGVSNMLISKRLQNFPANSLARRVYDKVSIVK
jgi:oligopeptide transport system substrate-binding protein